MYAIYGLPFTINRNPSHVSINLPLTYGSVMGRERMLGVKIQRITQASNNLNSNLVGGLNPSEKY